MSALSVQLAERAQELLGDREWHPYEATMRELMKLVPPGRGLRRNEQDRRVDFARRTGLTVEDVPPRKRDADVSKQIESGARTIVREFLAGPAFEVYPKQGSSANKQVRIHHEHRAVKASHDNARAARAEYEKEKLMEVNKLLAEQVEGLRSFLTSLGHGATARELAPPIDQ